MVKVKGDHLPAEDDVVITGISGRYAVAENIDEFQDMLHNKEDFIRPIERPDWKKNETLGIPNFASQISHKNKFDARFFGISSIHTNSTDPLLRILLEKVFEAIVDAGINPSELQGTNTAVFIGSNISESENATMTYPKLNNFSVLGHNRGMLANRISYWLNINGTSISMVSMETSGFETLTAAYNEMKMGRCDAAVVGSVNMIAHPEVSYHYNELGLLSKDGKCKVFDAQADGYARSEAIVALFLQKARAAKRIYATLIHSEFDHCGDRPTNFTTPYGAPLSSLMEHFYNTCEVNPRDIEYLEAEGHGTKLGDEEEMKAVEKVMLNGRKTPLLVGSVKSNMGHSDAAANLCSVTKVLIAMQTGVIPPNLHYNIPSPNIPALSQGKVKVVTENTPWNGGLAAMNSMSLTGNYAHVLLQSYGKDKPENTHSDGLPRLIVTSSRTEEGVLKILDKLESKPVDVEFVRLLHEVHSINVNNHLYRGFTVVPAGEKQIRDVKHYDQINRPVWFIFSGMGSQWSGMGRDLMQLPVCAATIETCHAILAEKGLDLKHIITTDDPSVFDSILHCFVGIAAIQLALVDVLTVLGIKADGMVGHSVGELGCAYADGCITLEQMILSAYYRGQASLQAELIRGFMAAVGIGYSQIKKIMPPELDVACRNSSNNCTISGPENDVKMFVEKLESKKIFARTVNVANIAYHSRYIQPAGPLLLESLGKLIPNPKPRSTSWVSSSVPEEQWDTHLARYCSAEYLTNNLLSPVLFEEASRHIPENAITIEVAPHGLLQSILRHSLSPDCINIALTRRNLQGLHFFLAAIGRLYLEGLMPQIKELYPPVQLPVSRGTPSISPLVCWDHTDSWFIAEDLLNDSISGGHKILLNLKEEKFHQYANHIINGCTIFPSFAYLKIAWETIATLQGTEMNRLPVVFENVRFLNQLQIEERGSQPLYFLVQRGSGHFEFSSDKMLLVTGTVLVPENIDSDFVQHLPALPVGNVEMSRNDFYLELERKGYQYRDPFKGVKHLTLGKEGSVTKVQWENNWVTFGEALLQVMMFQCTKHNQELQLPAMIRKIVINPLQFPDHGMDMEATFHRTLRTMRCGGLELQNLETKSFSFLTNKQPNLKLEALRFITYSNPKLENLHQFVAMSLEWIIENNHSNISLATVGRNVSILLNHIKSLLLRYPQITLNNTGFGKSHDILVVSKDSDLKSAMTMLNNGGFMLISGYEHTWKHDSDLIMIAEQQFGNEKLSLLRQATLPKIYQSQVLHLERNTSTWLQQIKLVKPCNRIYVVVELELQEIQAVLHFIHQRSSAPELEHVRYVLILDKEVHKFSLNERLYHEQLQHDLLVNVFDNGQWGSFCHIPQDTPLLTMVEKCESKLCSLESFEDIKITCLGLNPKDLTVLDSEYRSSELGSLEFSGYSKTGQRFMGAVNWNSKPTLERHFTWNVPESWSLQEAVTVPLAYATAYYSLVLKARIKPEEKVLVHAGWSSIGQAAIAVALDYDCTVFTTVANREQRSFLKECFPQIPDNHVYSCEDTNFETYIRKGTNGEGINIIINCLGGHKLQASINCLAEFGRFIQLGQNDVISNQIIGLSIFARCATVCGVTPEHLFKMSDEWKEALHSDLQNGLQRGVVRPLRCTVYPRHQIQLALRTLSEVNQTQKVILNMTTGSDSSTPHAVLMSSSQTFYIVVGENVNECLAVAEWLASKGVSQVAVTLRCKTVPSSVKYKIESIHSCYGTKVVLLPSVLRTLSHSHHLLEQAFSLCEGNLSGVFILPMEPVGQENSVTTSTVCNLDLATRDITTVKLFVCLLMKKAWSICEARHRAGLPALLINWRHCSNENLNLQWSLNVLDSLLRTKIQDPVIVLSEAEQEYDMESTAVPTLDMFLPSSVKNLASFGDDLLSDMSSSYWLEKLPSLSPGHGEVKEVPPVFLIPGLQGTPCKILKSLAMKLMYPTFCIRLQQFSSLTEMAVSLVKHVQEKQNMGPYNLVGISWGGVLTLELARQLEARGHSTRVILIDGAPETTQAAVRCLENEDKFDLNLVSRLLHIPDCKIKSNWSALLAEAMKEVPAILKPQLSAALTTLRSCLSALLCYKPTGDILKSEVTLVRPSCGSEDDNCGLDQFFWHVVKVHKIEGDHLTILQTSEIARIINDFIL